MRARSYFNVSATVEYFSLFVKALLLSQSINVLSGRWSWCGRFFVTVIITGQHFPFQALI